MINRHVSWRCSNSFLQGQPSLPRLELDAHPSSAESWRGEESQSAEPIFFHCHFCGNSCHRPSAFQAVNGSRRRFSCDVAASPAKCRSWKPWPESPAASKPSAAQSLRSIRVAQPGCGRRSGHLLGQCEGREEGWPEGGGAGNGDAGHKCVYQIFAFVWSVFCLIR